MELLYFVPNQNFESVKNALLKDDKVGRMSILFRDAMNFGKKESGSYIALSGLDDAAEKAKTIIGERGHLVEGKEREDVFRRIRMEEEATEQGFGSIFG
ncbi:MAG: hypothetical protein V1731_02315 [Candidatus Aenigmatarchaeota archaeon]